MMNRNLMRMSIFLLIASCLLAAVPGTARSENGRPEAIPSLEDLNSLFDGRQNASGAVNKTATPGAFALIRAAAGQSSGFKDRKCVECHSEFAPGTKGLHPIIDSWGCDACHVDAHTRPQKRYKWLSGDVQELCVRCHMGKEFKGSVQHSPAKMRLCTNCHDPHVSAKKKLLTSEPPTLCFDCHKPDGFLQKVRHSPVADGTCTDCHKPHSGDNPKLLVDRKICFTCHDEAGIAGAKVVHAPVKEMRCPECHNPHSSPEEHLLRSRKFCFNCHNPEPFKGVSMHSPAKSQHCDNCHQPHQSKFPKLLNQEMPGLCFDCHDDSDFKGKKVVHFPVKNGDCTDCHSPHAGAAPKLLKTAKICFECHDEKDFNGAGKHIKAEPTWCVGCHDPHQSDNAHLLRKK